jgi:GT2 family glycosyltransferase
VLALDDDSYPEQSDCLARLVKLFADQPRLAVAHFPQRSDEYPATLTQEDFGASRPTNSFPNSGACLRRSTYLSLPGFFPEFFHMYEEPDYALQCIAAGHEVSFEPVLTIRHHYSGRMRDEIGIHHRHARNELWSVLLRCPFPYLPGIALYRAASQLRYAVKRGWRWVVREPIWWWQALKGVTHCFRIRQPIPWERYRVWLYLR